MSDIAIKVENLSKAYQLGDFGTGSLTTDIERWWALMRGKEDPFLKIGETNDRTAKGTSDIVWSLKDINFDINEGDSVGIIGRNGAGKSTLLKLLSRVTSPTTGNIKVKGRIASLLEVGTGFHPELTGAENIFLNGAIMGMSKREIKKKFDEIVDFAGVERYIGTPVKRYSSGMYVRLAFAVAAYLDSEILIVDEVLAVGDADFQKKCLGKMGEVSKGEGRTILFVSHNMGSIIQLCNKGILLNNGTISLSSDIFSVVNKYLASNQSLNSSYIKPIKSDECLIEINEIQLRNLNKESISSFKYSEPILIDINLGVNQLVTNSSIFLTILDGQKNRVFSAEKNIIEGQSNYILTIEEKFLTSGRYSLQIFTHVPAVKRYYELEDVCHFEVIDDGSIFIKYGEYKHGSVFGRYTWD